LIFYHLPVLIQGLLRLLKNAQRMRAIPRSAEGMGVFQQPFSFRKVLPV
jgi:hypothetical protein